MRTKTTISIAKAANGHVCALNEGDVSGVNVIVADLVNTVKCNANKDVMRWQLTADCLLRCTSSIRRVFMRERSKAA